MKTARSDPRRPRTPNVHTSTAAGARCALRERGGEERSNLSVSNRKEEDGSGRTDQRGLSSASRR